MTETNAPNFFKTPFTPAYWKLAAKEFRSLRTLAVASLLIALDVVVARFYIPVGLNLRVYFNYLVTALLSLICGPVVGIAAGFVRDTIGFLLDPSWGYFFGYTVTAMASGLIYGLFFYRAKITVLRIALCKLLINVLVNIVLGCLWSQMMYQKGYLYFLSTSVPKNLLLLPAEILLLTLFLQVMLPVLRRAKLIPAQPTTRIPFFK